MHAPVKYSKCVALGAMQALEVIVSHAEHSSEQDITQAEMTERWVHTAGIQTYFGMTYGYSYNWTVGPYVFTQQGNAPGRLTLQDNMLPTTLDGYTKQAGASWLLRHRLGIRAGLTGDTNLLTFNKSQGVHHCPCPPVLSSAQHTLMTICC